MTETPPPSEEKDLPEAVAVPHRRRLPLVWIIPLVAALIGGWLAVKAILEAGPKITIVFKTAEGIEPGKTEVKYKDVNIGKVTAVTLTDHFSKVQVTAQIEKSAEGLLVEDAKFWLVQPRVTFSGVSGLGTLLSGNYIGFEAGKSQAARFHFTALDVPPVLTEGLAGRQFILHSDTLGSLGFGSPVYFRKLPVGQLVGFDLAKDGQSVDIKIFVNAPYDCYVNGETRFWNASGIDMSVGASGIDLRTESLTSVLLGGIAFETPPNSPVVEPSAPNAVFTLYQGKTEAMKKPITVVDRYALQFSESVRGLSEGAPVTLLGIQVGEVSKVGLESNSEAMNVRANVIIHVYPERLPKLGKDCETDDLATRCRYIQRLVEEGGLRAQLRSGSLLTGQLYVAFELFPNATKVAVDWEKNPPQLPTVPGNLEDLQTKLSSIAAKLDKIPFEALGKDLHKAVQTLDQTLQSANKVLVHVDSQVVPGVKANLEELRGALTSAKEAMSSAEKNLVGAEAPLQQDLHGALQELDRAARSARLLFDYLERNPSALIRGKQKE